MSMACNMAYGTTEQFTAGEHIAGNLALKISVSDYPTICSKPLALIRKEVAEMNAKKSKPTRQQPTGKKSTASDNIVESAIGKSAEQTFSALEGLKKKKKKPSNSKTPSGTKLKETVPTVNKSSDKTTKPVSKNTEQFTGTAVFEKEPEKENKNLPAQESEGIDIVDFLHAVTTLDQVLQFAQVLVKYEYIIVHGENNGTCVYSEFITCLDRITNKSQQLITYICKNIEVFQSSLADMTDLFIEYCDAKETQHTELATIFRVIRPCMR